MKSVYNANARKRPVNLTLNEDLVMQAKSVTNNLSSVIETLLVEYVAREQQEQIARSKALDATAKLWNEFNGKTGSIADEYSSL